MHTEYETVIGLEVHVELNTGTKIFCPCKVAFGGRPNTRICPVCMGMPGALPVLNGEVLKDAVMTGLATGCSITRRSRFDRKNYFYPDNPQNYQISQLYMPICRNGYIEIETENGQKKIGITQIHMEEDAGKLIHEGDDSFIDFNRAGVPLLEIVSEPDMRSAEEVIAYLEGLKDAIGYLEVSDLKLQEGSMRVDVNLSVRKAGDKTLGTRTEMKNLNSFAAITAAVKSERERQISIIEAGGQVEQETRRFDMQTGTSYTMRSKEDRKDYRYFPDPDLLPVIITDEYLESLKKQLPETRKQKMQRYKEEYGIPGHDIEIITRDIAMARFFERAAEISNNPKAVSNYLMGETLRLLRLNEMDAKDIRFSPKHLADLIGLQESKKINSTVAKQIFEVMFEEDIDPLEYVKAKGLLTVSDDGTLLTVIKEVIAENEKSVSDYRSGKTKAIGYLVGQTMKKLSGRGDAENVRRLLETELSE